MILNPKVAQHNLTALFQDVSETRLRRATLVSQWSGECVPNLNNLSLIIDTKTMKDDERRCGHKRLLANGRLTRHPWACSNVAMVAMKIR